MQIFFHKNRVQKQCEKDTIINCLNHACALCMYSYSTWWQRSDEGEGVPEASPVPFIRSLVEEETRAPLTGGGGEVPPLPAPSSSLEAPEWVGGTHVQGDDLEDSPSSSPMESSTWLTMTERSWSMPQPGADSSEWLLGWWWR